jgi:hypothetical protein
VNARGAAAVPAGRRALQVALALLAAAAALATPWLVRPWNPAVPWYESTALFPRAALALVVLGALGALLQRRRSADDEETEELDAAASHPRQVLHVGLCFTAHVLLVPVLGLLPSTALFVLAAGLGVGLSLRSALALALPLALVLWTVFTQVLHVNFGGWL